jgi:multicomponent Na+:H+ antiporter subunit G
LTDLLIYLGGTLLLLGSVFTLLAAVGVVRLPDLYTRMHAASKAGAVGGGLILLAVALLSQDAAVALRAVIGVIFLLLTTPISAHLLAKASYQAGYRPAEGTVVDEITVPPENMPGTN